MVTACVPPGYAIETADGQVLYKPPEEPLLLEGRDEQLELERERERELELELERERNVLERVRVGLEQLPIVGLRTLIVGDELRLFGVAATPAAAELAGTLASNAAPAFAIDNAITVGVDDVPGVEAERVLELVRARVETDARLNAAVRSFDIIEQDGRLVLGGITTSVDARDDIVDLVAVAAPSVPIVNNMAVVVDDIYDLSGIVPSDAPLTEPE